jgi:thiol:disulfide interchange protein DsbD
MMNFIPHILIALTLSLTLQFSPYLILNAQEFPLESQVQEDKSPIFAEFLQENESIQPGHPFSLILHLNIDKNWHTYWKNPGDSGMPLEIEWNLPEGFTVETIQWQTPQRFNHDSVIGFGYENEMILLAEIHPAATIQEEVANIEASITWLACSDMMCLPGNSEVSTKLIVKNEIPKSLLNNDFKKFRDNLPKKDWDLEAYTKTDGSIELKAKAPKDYPTLFTRAYFCPEVSEFVDHKDITHFSNASSNLNERESHYQVALKRTVPKKDNDESLKGILVLLHDNGTEVIKETLAVDIPLKENITSHDNIIASVSKNEINKQILTNSENETPPSELEGHFVLALLFSFIGGMILNLMPCVLPVLSLKIFSFVKMSGESKKLCFQHGVAFSVGVLISFWVLAGLLLVLQAYGESVGWGFQLQEPIFVAVLASIVFILGLNLFGLMEFGMGITSVAGNISHKKTGFTNSFLSGVLATAVATPCTGPFLGSAVGYAVTLPPAGALLIFTMVGLGMSFPYLLLSAYPSLLRFIPKPGNWMITFKEIMGLLMMATTIWLLWVFSAQTSNLSLILLIGALFFFGIGCWIYGKWGSPLQKQFKRRLSFVFSLFFLGLGTFTIYTATESTMEAPDTTEEIATRWEPYSKARIEELQKQGIPVFVDYTAKWCLICQTNHLSLSTFQAEQKFKSAGVVRMKADWTKKDPVITQDLRKFGRSSVPLYVLYGTNPSEKPKILPQVLTSDVVVSYLEEI